MNSSYVFRIPTAPVPWFADGIPPQKPEFPASGWPRKKIAKRIQRILARYCSSFQRNPSEGTEEDRGAKSITWCSKRMRTGLHNKGESPKNTRFILSHTSVFKANSAQKHPKCLVESLSEWIHILQSPGFPPKTGQKIPHVTMVSRPFLLPKISHIASFNKTEVPVSPCWPSLIRSLRH